MLFAYGKNKFSHDMAHFVFDVMFSKFHIIFHRAKLAKEKRRSKDFSKSKQMVNILRAVPEKMMPSSWKAGTFSCQPHHQCNLIFYYHQQICISNFAMKNIVSQVFIKNTTHWFLENLTSLLYDIKRDLGKKCMP